MFALTPRLTLRPPWPEDAPALAAALRHPAVASSLTGTGWRDACHDPLAWSARVRGPHDPYMIIADRSDGRLLGGLSLDVRDLAIWLEPAGWGRGYATEAGRAGIAMARHTLGVPRLTARGDEPRVARLLDRLGFVPIGAGLHELIASPATDARRLAA